ncbi:MAG TPA: NAD(P)/FAD-dependent oxidoreductase [Anaerolineae bacterium]|nr:NAD(P)/FAD-dependent oxidoreductase [Anaerolineae bacterium]HMR62531.1 NAD(P)/FAD-dependent oxidoreductase [Anaerolineae bacterium]
MKIAVIGAGVAGLAAAYDLAKAGHQVIIFEAANYTGGLAAGFKDEQWDWHLEHFYHHWFETDDDILRLLHEIGQGHKVFFPRPITSLYVDGQVYPFDSPTRILAFPKLSWLAKIRFGLVTVYLRLTQNWRALEQETAHDWARRKMGEEAYRVIWEPLLIGKFGDHYKEVNMAWLWARLHKRSFKLGYFEGGFQGFVDALTQTVGRLGVEIRLNTRITRITADNTGQFTVYDQPALGGDDHSPGYTFDRVLATVSPSLLSRLVPTLPADYLAALQQLKSMGAVVLILALKHGLTANHYWINLPKSEELPFLALVEHTNFIDRHRYGGDHIVYCGDYLDPDHEYFDLSQEELLDRFLPALAKFNPNFEPSWVRKSWLFRTKYAQPVPPINHSANIPSLATPIPGLYWASMSQVYPWDRGTNYAVEIGRRAARLLLSEAQQVLQQPGMSEWPV